jgi:Mg-chelatase subunit ChlD
LTKYNPDYVKKNLNIPEFQREIKKNITEIIEGLRETGMLNDDLSVSSKGFEMASLVLYTEELDHLVAHGILGEKVHKKQSIYGDKQEVRTYKKGDRYKDISIRKSVKTAIRRGHDGLTTSDLVVHQRESKGQISIIYALDASGSMKGDKLDMAKKAGVALAYKAIEGRDKVGLIVFGADIKEAVEPTDDFVSLVHKITGIKAAKETNIAKTIAQSIEMFGIKEMTKHLLILTDALPTVGQEPEKETVDAVFQAAAADITVSIIGINLNDKGKQLAEKIVQIGKGRLYMAKDSGEVDKIILEDYYSVL